MKRVRLSCNGPIVARRDYDVNLSLKDKIDDIEVFDVLKDVFLVYNVQTTTITKGRFL